MPAAAVKKRCKKRLTSRMVSRLMVRRALKRRRTESSGLERKVLGWLDNAGIAYQGQYAIGRCHVDALIEPDLVLEINGCYWHRCPKCYPENTKKNAQRRMKDRRRYRYLLMRGFRLLLLWEHELCPDTEDATIAMIRARMADAA